MRGVLRGADGPPESTAGTVWPSVVHRLFRRVVLRAGDCVAGGRFAESAVVSGPGRDRGGAGPLDVVAYAAADRRRDARGGVHVGVERLADAGLVRGKTVGIDATTLEANAAMRSIERRDTGESYEAFVRSVAEASGVETPTRADLARFDRSRKHKKTSNKEWTSPQDPAAKIAKMKDGRTHVAHKAEHGVDMDTGAIVSVTVQDASDGDSATLPVTLIMAAAQVALVQPDGPGVEEVVADKGYHSDETLVALGAVGVRNHVSEPARGRRCWQDKKTGETPPEKRAAQKALYANRRRVRGRRGRRLQRCRGEVVERSFAHMYETGGMRRVWVRGHENVRKRVLIQAAACNIGLLLRRLTGVGTPRSLQGRAVSAICRLIGRLIYRWGRLTRAWGFKWTPTALVGSIAHRQAA